MEKRYIGIDLHRNRFTFCIRLENERTYVTEWALEDFVRFVKKLRASDEVAVEITSNTWLFYEAVAPHGGARGGGAAARGDALAATAQCGTRWSCAPTRETGWQRSMRSRRRS